ncbi:hypothetical protein HMPREF3092_03425 [Brevibacterium sp. HMSC24B04]|nr:hypothetical protein HMPREF3092_03425 [Brevibacterium sp. HMSC24B04]
MTVNVAMLKAMQGYIQTLRPFTAGCIGKRKEIGFTVGGRNSARNRTGGRRIKQAAEILCAKSETRHATASPAAAAAKVPAHANSGTRSALRTGVSASANALSTCDPAASPGIVAKLLHDRLRPFPVAVIAEPTAAPTPAASPANAPVIASEATAALTVPRRRIRKGDMELCWPVALAMIKTGHTEYIRG